MITENQSSARSGWAVTASSAIVLVAASFAALTGSLPHHDPDLYGDVRTGNMPRYPHDLADAVEYEVKEGDNWWGIAARAYGDGNDYSKIILANPTVCPDALLPGTRLKIPRNN